MNIYKPYDVIADKGNILHLKLNENRERTIFTTVRIMPVLIIMFVWFLLQQVGKSIPMGWVYAIIITAIIVSVLLLIKSYITEVKMQGEETCIVRKKVFGTNKKKIHNADIENIELKRKTKNGGSAEFILKLKAGRQCLLLYIPTSDVNDQNIVLIKQRFDSLIK